MLVVVEVGVPLWGICEVSGCCQGVGKGGAYGTSEGVTGSEGGGGMLRRVGPFDIVTRIA